MKYIYDTFSTPTGDFSIALDENGAVAATAFGGLVALKQQLRAHEPQFTRDVAGLRGAREQVQAYFAGTLRKFTLPLAPEGTVFQQSVWSELRRIPFGQTRSYGEVAAEVGNPKASRAVGRANGTNPICLIVPCHRVIGADGSLTGFFYGNEIKRILLEHENALPGGKK
jgi:methylated-DNA-[protein]-cysteine S-methyltransferase